MRPDLIWRCKGNAAEINRSALGNPDAFEPCREGALDSFRAVLAESAIDLPSGMPPMAAGLFGYMSYDMVRSEEHTSELQSLMRISYAVFCLKKKNTKYNI